MSTSNFCEAYKRPGDPDWYFRVYHYNGDREVVTVRSKQGYATKEGALDAGVEYCEEHGIEAALQF